MSKTWRETAARPFTALTRIVREQPDRRQDDPWEGPPFRGRAYGGA